MNVSNIFSKQNMGEVKKLLPELNTRNRKYDAMIFPIGKGYLLFEDLEFCEYLLATCRKLKKRGITPNLSHYFIVKKK